MKPCQGINYRSGFAMPRVHYASLTRVLVLVITMGIIGACGFLKPIDSSSRSHSAKPNNPDLSPVYHEFDDILVPKAMQINRKLTRLSETNAVRTGVISLEGNLTRKDIIRFFKSNMVKDNWTRVDQLISPRSLLQYEKHNRWCVVTITDRPNGFGSQLEIWVIPKNSATSSGLLK